jgi:hypothetical protein
MLKIDKKSNKSKTAQVNVFRLERLFMNINACLNNSFLINLLNFMFIINQICLNFMNLIFVVLLYLLVVYKLSVKVVYNTSYESICF